jgi:hypothetical protein
MTEAEELQHDAFGKGSPDTAAQLRRIAQFLKDNDQYLEQLAD